MEADMIDWLNLDITSWILALFEVMRMRDVCPEYTGLEAEL